jgi:cytochrome c biogenesis protein CcmG/thiol:disulfide interchange protein DsbE
MKRSAVPLVAVLAVAALVGLLVYGVVTKGEDKTLDEAVAKGQRPSAPAMTLPLLGQAGKTQSLAGLKGKVVVLNFWASWCDPCKAEAPELEATQKRLQKSGDGTVLGVTYRDTSEDSLSFVKSHDLSYPSIRDIDGKLAQDYGTRALPETFVIDRNGNVVALSRGQVTQKFLDAAVNEALAK